jgi:hypothetical protein
VDAIYEFTPALDLISATYSRHYWETHAALEAAGTLDHRREQCPDRDGSRVLIAWTPVSGWASAPTRPE